jgi:hypothetical protein
MPFRHAHAAARIDRRQPRTEALSKSPTGIDSHIPVTLRFTGESHDQVADSNDKQRNPWLTVLEFLRRKLD